MKKPWQGAKELWLTGKSQPNACDKLFSVWRASGKQDPLAYLERIRLAMKAGNTGTVTVLAGADACRLPDYRLGNHFTGEQP